MSQRNNIYKHRGWILARPYVPGEDLTGISVSLVDLPNVLFKKGWIATNPYNTNDKWYIDDEYFQSSYELDTSL